MKSNYLIINYIDIEKDFVLVGATDDQRWKWDTDEGMSGVDAKTIVYVTLKGDPKSRIAIQEEAGFHCAPHDPIRRLAMTYIYELFEIAWDIMNNEMSFELATEKYFGFKISISNN